jgi:predicted SAM-dependent methyltransferase
MIIPAVSKPQLKISPGTREDIMKIVIGAGKTHYDGWIHTQEDELNLLNESSFLKYASQGSVDCFLAEHVWEHMTQDEGIQAARNCHKFLKPGGYLRVAVPDKNFRNDWYQNMVKVGGPGPADHPAADHKIVYDYRQFQLRRGSQNPRCMPRCGLPRKSNRNSIVANDDNYALAA